MADYIADAISAMDGGRKFLLMSKHRGKGLPLVAWRLKAQEGYDGKDLLFLLSSLFCEDG